MEYLLRIKGLYRITLEIEVAPIEMSKKTTWNNKNDLACGLLMKFKILLIY